MTYHRKSAVPTDFAFLAQLCGSTLGSLPQSGDQGRIDPEALLEHARRHRVQAIAWEGLKVGGWDTAPHAQLESDARTIHLDNLVAADVAARLTDALSRAGVRHLFVKGLALAAQAYGQPLTKMSSDIDLLVDPSDLEMAARVLGSMQYRCALPRRCSLMRWHQLNKESVWVADNLPVVEVHTRLADNPALLATLSASGKGETIEILPGIKLPTLTAPDTLSYLAVHGTSSMWFRLKWLLDFEAMSRRVGPVHTLPGCETAMKLARNLSAAVFAGGRPEGLLSRMALSQLTQEREPTTRPMGTMTIHLGQVLMGGSAGFAASEAVRQVRTLIQRN